MIMIMNAINAMPIMITSIIIIIVTIIMMIMINAAMPIIIRSDQPAKGSS